LNRSAGVLLVPDRNQGGLEPAAHGAEPVHTGVAGGTQRNLQSALMDAGAAVMNGEFTLSPTTLTLPTVALKYSPAMAGKVEAGVRLPEITAAAQSGAKQLEAATGTEKPGLPTPQPSTAGR
jgi:hypothetical protein